MKVFISSAVLAISIFYISRFSPPYLIQNLLKESVSNSAYQDYGEDDPESLASSYDQSDFSDYSRNKISYLNNLLSGHEIYGTWQDIINNAEDSNIQFQGGYATLSYSEDYQPSDETFDMVLCLYNGAYSNTNYSCITFAEFVPFIPAGTLDEQNMTLNFGEIPVHLAQGKDYGINGLGNECLVQCSIYFIDKKTGQPFSPQYNLEIDKTNFAVQFLMESPSCSMKFITNLMIPEDKFIHTQSKIYCLIMTLAAFFQCFLCHQLEMKLRKDQVLCQRISQGTLRVINAFDLFIALQGSFNLNNKLIGFTALPYTALAVYFEPRVIHTISEAQGNLKERGFRCLNLTNCIWFILSLTMAIVSSFFHKPEWMFLLFCFHQVPQILHNYQTQRKYRLFGLTVLLPVLPKILYIAYVLVCPQNLFRYSSNNQLAGLLVNIFLIQFGLLLIQQSYPMLCAHPKTVYQYFRIFEKDCNRQICSICLEGQSSDQTKVDERDNSHLENTREKTKAMMILTPCKHEFHGSCLRDWTKFKSICPYCRFNLPPLPEEDE